MKINRLHMAVLAAMLGSAALVGQDKASVNIKIPGGGEIAINSAKMEEIAKKMEQAKASGNTADVAKAANDMLGAVTGSSGTPIAAAARSASTAGLPWSRQRPTSTTLLTTTRSTFSLRVATRATTRSWRRPTSNVPIK